MITSNLTPEQKQQIKAQGFFQTKAQIMGKTIEFIQAIESGRVNKPHVDLNQYYERLGDLKDVLDTCPVWLEESVQREIKKGRETMRELLKASK